MTNPPIPFAQQQPITLSAALADFVRGEWGFAGTRAGMRAFQQTTMRRILTHGQPIVLRHGGAYGADTEIHAIWRELDLWMEPSVVDVWPTDSKRARLFQGQPRVTVESVMASVHRNMEIVKRSQLLIAAPNTEHTDMHANTWEMIHLALRRKVPVLIIWPESQRMSFARDHVIYRVSPRLDTI